MMHSKKAGVSFDSVEFIVKIFVLIFVLIFLVMSTKSFFNMKINADTPRFEVVEQEILGSPQLLYFDKSIGQFRYGILDWDNFTADNLNSTFNVNEQNTLSMNLTLKVFNGSSVNTKNIYLNKKYYEYMLSKCSAYSVDSDTTELVSLPVLVYYKGRIRNGILTARIIINYGG